MHPPVRAAAPAEDQAEAFELGHLAADGRGAEQLLQVCRGLHMIPVATRIGLTITREQAEGNSGEIDPPTLFEEHLSDLRQAFDDLLDQRARSAG